jgi:glycolate dehydrogenase FAD-binding subunit
MTRPGTTTDAVDGVIPKTVVEPATAEEVGATLELAFRDKRSVVARGGGTKLGWGPPPRSVDILLSLSRLNAVVAHRHGDLTATIQAGAPLAAVNQQLAQHGQWIPIDAPWPERATIGGLVATNDSGPRRHRYGAPRDLIIGVEFARADGQLAKGGGIVVKNVAGYDLCRLMTGSFGSLCVIVAATFKLFPLTTASKTLSVDVKQPGDLGALSAAILSSHLTPTALEFATRPLRLLIRFESIAASVDQQAISASALIAAQGFGAQTTSGEDEVALWKQHGERVWGGSGAVVKVSVLPTELAATLGALDSLAGSTNYAAAGRAGLGVFLVNIEGDTVAQSRAIDGLRSRLPVGRGSAVIVRGSSELRARTDVWGPVGDGLSAMRAVKHQFDPAGILNPGRGPGGL